MSDFPIIRAALEGRRAAHFEASLGNVVAFTDEGVLIKAELEAIKVDFTRAIDAAWEILRKKHFFIDHAKRVTAVEDLFWSFSIPYPHVLPGFLKKTLKAKGLPDEVRDDLIALLSEGIVLNDMLESLKPLVGKRAPKKTKVEIEREGKERTCQVCGRGILAEGGIIAHHGYQRPGMGWQTPSCGGARELPFEISRDALGTEIEGLKAYRARRQSYRAEVEAETVSLPINYEVSEQDPHRAPGFKTVVKKMVHVTREDWDAIKAETPEAFAGKYGPRKTTGYGWLPFDFDAVKAQVLGTVDSEIDFITGTITAQQKRYDGWKQTLEFVDGAYRPFVGAAA